MATNNKNFKIVSESRTANATWPQVSHGLNSAHINIDVTEGATSINTLILHLEGKDAASGKWYNIISSPVITSVGTTLLKVFKGAPTTANLSVNDFLPEDFRIRSEHANATPITFSININLKK